MGAMTCFCVTAWLLSCAWSLAGGDLNNLTNGILIAFAVIAAIATCGAAMGTLTGRIVDSVIGLMVIITVILFVAVFAMGILPLPGN
jgi:hypothetical protein